MERLKREECKRTKHDSVFSTWKMLIGPSDWESYLVGKDGVEKYRTHNLPSSSSPGLYELGVAASYTGLGRNVHKLDQDHIVVVYLGQAENVRIRLQEYGRGGSHLERGNSFGYADNGSCFSKGPGLFRDIFSRGFPIVFRWAAIENKNEAERTEAQLLDIFDYAWNKGRNGARRPIDIHRKLDKITASDSSFIGVARKLKQLIGYDPFGKKQEGITIKAIVPPSTEKFSSTCNYQEPRNFHSLVFKFNRWRPQLVKAKHDVTEESSVCGLSSHYDSEYTSKPTEESKREEKHTLKSNELPSKSPAEGKSISCGLQLEDGYVCVEDPFFRRKKVELQKENKVDNLSDNLERESCGVALGNGSICNNRPVEGRKRCKEHKGWRTNYRSVSEGKGRKALVCGAKLKDGSVCPEVPVRGRKWCELHKGYGSVTEEKSLVCGVSLEDGSVCAEVPIRGRKRCELHKGGRIKYGSATKGKSLVCGVGLEDGSVCVEVPVNGRKRCELHKGRRLVTFS